MMFYATFEDPLLKLLMLTCSYNSERIPLVISQTIDIGAPERSDRSDSRVASLQPRAAAVTSNLDDAGTPARPGPAAFARDQQWGPQTEHDRHQF